MPHTAAKYQEKGRFLSPAPRVNVVYKSAGKGTRAPKTPLICPVCNDPYNIHHKCHICTVILHDTPHMWPAGDTIMAAKHDPTLCQECYNLYILHERDIYLSEIAGRIVCTLENI